MTELLERARQLVAGGPYSPNVSEIIAVHAAIYPTRDPVCDHCPAEQGKAYFAIKRWVDQQDNSSSTSTTLTVSKHTSTARFHSDTTTLFPHGLGVAYSNDNLTDKAARYILKNDPDAAQFFKVLPPDAKDGEDEAPAAAPAPSAPAPAASVPEGFDYAKLAAALLDEQQRRATAGNDQPAAPAAPAQPALTASAGGNAAGTDEANKPDGDEDQDGEKPVRLSRMNKEQLTAAYTAELGQAPAEGLTNDELRDAIADKRAGQQDPE